MKYVVQFDGDDIVSLQENKNLLLADTTEAQVYKALVVGVRDFVQQNGFTGVVIGLSGGVDFSFNLSYSGRCLRCG